MLKQLRKNATKISPTILLDKEKSIFKITGISMAENSYDLYQEVIEWFTEYSKDPNKKTVLEFKLVYLNSSAIINIVRIIKILADLYKNGHDVKIIWYFETDDIEIQEHGDDISELFNIPVEITQLKQE